MMKRNPLSCQFVEITVNGTVVVDQVDCNNPNCPSSDANPNNKS